jgi:hypothetical protein
MVHKMLAPSSRMAPLLVAFVALSVPPAHAATTDLAKALRPLCSNLQQSGWVAPEDPLAPGKHLTAETDIPGVAYLCNVEKPLRRAGDGRSPALGSLLSDVGKDPGIIFSANVWCEGDRVNALEQLADHIERSLRGVSILAPADALEAIRKGAKGTVTASGLSFQIQPIEVDPNACSSSADERLSAVLMKIDVSIEAVGGN